MRIRLCETRLGLRNSTVRIPFRYGSACLTRCPQAVLAATLELNGQRATGYSGDCLPPSWFDKSPARGYRQQIDDMLWAIATAERQFADALRGPDDFFNAWLAVYHQVQAAAKQRGLTPLLASFGVSMVERAILDGAARAAGLSFAQAVRGNLYGLAPEAVHPSLAGLEPRDWLPAEPAREIFVRHTVGLGDPLTAAEIPPDDRLDDGYPQALEQYIQQCGLRYFKIKVANRLEHDLDRLRTIAALIERHRGNDYLVTLDGNELYRQAAEFDELMQALRADPRLATLLENTLVVEQPLERSIALDPDHTAGIRELGRWRPVIIDESDGELSAYALAMELGYRGVSSKNCKGPIKSLLNAGLTWLANDRGQRSEYVMTGEDLCSVGVIPTQADLCLIATLGLAHIERNGHHYHPGLSYLPAAQQQAALSAHADFYAERHGRVSPCLAHGRFQIASLQCVGFGFAVEPEMDAMESAEEWRYESLGLAAN